MSAPRYIRVVSLWIHPGQELAFEAFEREAVGVMARHGGRIDRAVRVTGQGVDAPFEVHVVSFPDPAAADSYASDPATLELKARPASIIARAKVLEGSEAGPY